jgi:prepilin-type N-terminal cleavage/methylation domain-containing protein
MSARDHERGFTLVELLVAITILGVIAAPLSMAFITGVRFLGRTDEKFNDSRSALVSAAYFASDVAGANLIVRNDPAACGGSTAVVSFDSSDSAGAVGGAQNNEVSYVYDTSIPTSYRLLRKYCANAGAAVTSVAGVSLGASPVVTCYDPGNVVDATCANATWVKMVVTQKTNQPSTVDPNPVAFTFTLEGTSRPT